MAISKDQLLAKIDKLFVDVNTQYAELTKSKELEGLEIALMASNLEYLAAQVKALHYFEGKNANAVEAKENLSFFTPSSSLVQEVDEQETYHEIEEATVHILEETPKVEVISTSVEEKVELVQEEVKPTVEEVIVTRIETEVVVAPEPVAVPFTPEVVQETIMEEEEVARQEESPARPLTINELIQQQKQAGVNLTQQFQTSAAQDKVVDLKTAISLNDKLLFIKDLFNGYSLAYSEALELLNRFDNYAEADAFLQSNYALKNGWGEKPQTVDKFYSLLRKKFNA